jgi:hypothetical protein
MANMRFSNFWLPLNRERLSLEEFLLIFNGLTLWIACETSSTSVHSSLLDLAERATVYSVDKPFHLKHF